MSEPSKFFTLTSLLLLMLVFLTMAGFSAWSWKRRKLIALQLRQTVDALRQSEMRLVHLSNQMPIALFSYQPGHGFITVSEGISQLLPIDREQLLANPAALTDALDPDDSRNLAWLGQGEECPARVFWLGKTRSAKDGDEDRWLQISAAIEISPAGERFLNGVMIDVSGLMLMKQAVENSREALKRLAAHREDERENEYRRLAREFHDELGQVLTSARLRLQLLAREPGSMADQAIGEVDAMLVDAYRSVKTIAADLRPPALNLGLSAAIEWQAERTLQAAGMRYTLAIRPEAESLDEKTLTTLFRIVQESFSNIARYSGAKNVHVSLRQTGASLQLEIADDGGGFVVAEVDQRAHFGLAGMRERVDALGGQLDIDSALNEGTRIYVTIPMGQGTNA